MTELALDATVVGLGKIGLPLAVRIAEAGVRVRGADIAPAVVELVNRGVAPFPGEAELDERLARVVAAGTLTASTDTAAAVAASNVVVVVVPLVVDDQASPDYRALDAATAAIAPALRPGVLVSYETTLPVGTTRHRFGPALAAGSGLTLGDDLLVGHSPERVSSGRVFADLRRYPKLVGGLDLPSGARAVEFYEAVLDFDHRDDLPRPNGVWDLGSAEAAELTKLAETTYRNLNIGFANELAVTADRIGVDVRAVIGAANSQPFSHIHAPGLAVGGHCIPVYPWFFLESAPGAEIVRAGLAANEAMPAYAVALLEDLLGSLDGRIVAVLGAAYRGGVKETAFSGVFPVVAELSARGAKPVVHDPLYDEAELAALGFSPYRLGEACDAVIVQTDHAGYRALGAESFPGVVAVVDGRSALDRSRWPGVPFRQIGDGGGAPASNPGLR